MGTKTQKLSNIVDQVVQWQAVKTADFTAVAGEGYFINTTSAAVTVTLPASPKIGDTISVNDYTGTFGTNNVTVGRNGKNIQGNAGDITLNTNRQTATFVYLDETQGWSASNYSTASFASFIAATGGTVTTSGDYKIHQFTGDGCFVVSSVGNPAGSVSVDYLVVAGGGGGGNSNGGGGGAGGFRMASSFPVTATTYPITVGAGGTGMIAGTPDACGPANPGSNSVFSTITSTGGGGGGSGAGGSNPGKNGAPGGSGGGGGTNFGAGGSGNTPPVSPAQGFLGGTGAGPGSPVPGFAQGGGGGGGASAQGTDAPGTVPGGNAGPGGAGGDATPIFGAAPQPYYLTNSPLNGAVACGVFAGGGGGGAGTTAPITKGVGGAGGGGNGGDPSTPLTGSGIAGIANSGGGGGGSKGPSPSPCTVGGTGGKGIVILRYKFQ